MRYTPIFAIVATLACCDFRAPAPSPRFETGPTPTVRDSDPILDTRPDLRPEDTHADTEDTDADWTVIIHTEADTSNWPWPTWTTGLPHATQSPTGCQGASHPPHSLGHRHYRPCDEIDTAAQETGGPDSAHYGGATGARTQETYDAVNPLPTDESAPW